MRFRKPVSVLLVIALLSCCNFASARDLPVSDNAQHTPDTSTQEVSSDVARLKQALALPGQAVRSEQQKAPMVESYLLAGKLATGEIDLSAKLKGRPKDDQLRFELGTLQFLRAIEGLGQSLYRYGLRDLSTRGLGIPLTRLPIAPNPAPQVLSYHRLQQIFETFGERLCKAEATLAPITDASVKLPLHFGMIRLDLNGDGHLNEDESLWKVYAGLSGNRDIKIEQAKQFSIDFDRGDVHWLRGYCHLLMAICDVYLAHDTSETFARTAHILFAKVESPYKFLSRGKSIHRIGADDIEILDLIALIHLIQWEVVEPQRMASALHHLEAVVAQSKVSWKFIMSETDDLHEWLPNPKQTGVIPNVRVTEKMVSAWSDVMNEAGKLLAGDALIPFWRGDDSRGINLRRVFTEPRTLDLVLWVQGSAAAPYLENGRMTKGTTWTSLQRTFGSQFPGFALWFN
jgi:hypothetical protein